MKAGLLKKANHQRAHYTTYTVLFVVLCLVIIGSTLIGSYSISAGDVWLALTDPSGNRSSSLMLWEFRLPRLACALLVGALFASSGYLLQGITGNPLADPSLVGVSQGAAFAVVMLVVLFNQANGVNRMLAAMLGSLVTALIIYGLTYRQRAVVSALAFVLTGVGVSLFITALTSTLLTYGQLGNVMTALSWLSGSLHRVSAAEVVLLSISSLILLPCAWFIAHFFKAQQLGNELAKSLGVPLRKIQTLQLLVAVLAAAVATAVVGPIGFVGLIAPHLSRNLLKGSPRRQLFVCQSLGALLVACADLLGRTLWAPMQIPAGIVTTLVGAPFLLVLLFTNPQRS